MYSAKNFGATINGMVAFEKRNGQGLEGCKGLMEVEFELCLGNQ